MLLLQCLVCIASMSSLSCLNSVSNIASPQLESSAEDRPNGVGSGAALFDGPLNLRDRATREEKTWQLVYCVGGRELIEK
uniref:Secreted protein n=1 Tax=Arundo donax TaxID=35708 RepID=A0A0A8ZYX9_ARUDO